MQRVSAAGGLTLPRGVFRANSTAMNNMTLKTKHFAHVKEYIAKQELMGNIVRIPRAEMGHIYVY